MWSLVIAPALASSVSAYAMYGYWDAGDESVVEEAEWYTYNSGSTASPNVWGSAATGWDLYFDGLAGYQSTGVFLVTDNWWGWGQRCGVEDSGTDGTSLWIEPSCLTGENGLAGVLFMSYDSWADGDRALGYVYASDPTATAPYTPSILFNSSGGATRVIHRSAGRYQVRFEGITDPSGVPLVTPYTSGNQDLCRVTGWVVAAGGLTVDLACTRSLSYTDMPFSLAYTAGGVLTGAEAAGGSDDGFYAWVDMTSGSGPSVPAISWSPDGWSDVQVTRYGPGEYTVWVTGLASGDYLPYSIQITNGAGPAVCEPTSFPLTYGGAVEVGVYCMNSRGWYLDSPFAVVASVGGT